MRLVLMSLVAAPLLMAQMMDRTKPPQTPPVPEVSLPPVAESTLLNGLTIMLVEDNRFPLVTIRLSFQAGTKFDPADAPGLSESIAALVSEGTKTRSARQIAEDLASIGGSLNGSSSPDALTLAGSALSESLPRLLDIAADVARNATFPEDEIALYKQNRLQTLLEQRTDPYFLADEQASKAVFGANPYAHIAPTETSIGKLDRAALTGFRDRLLAPNNATLILLGRLGDRAALQRLFEEKFGSWQSKQIAQAPAAEIPKPRRRLILVDRPGSVQMDVRIARLAATRRDPDYFPLMVGETILGGGTSSRMFLEIREKNGWAYDAHTELDARREAGLFSAITQVRNEVVGEALQGVFAEMERITREPVPASELTDVKNYLGGRFVLGLETQGGLANTLNMLKTMGLPLEYLQKYTTRVRSVEADELKAAAARYMAPDSAAVVVVGDAAKIGKALEKIGQFEVVKPGQ
jgi:zinc protease